MERLRTVLHAGDPITVEGIACYLRTRPEIQLLKWSALAEADVLVMSAEVVDVETMKILQRASASASAKILLLANEVRESDLATAVKYGVVSVLSRQHATGERILTTLASIRHGQRAEEHLDRLLTELERVRHDVLRPRGAGEPGLSPRERQVLRLLADGCDTAQIALAMSYSERTVKNIVQAVLSRMNLRNRAHAVAYAMRSGIL